MSWNDEKIEKLKKLWAEGHSAGQIAERIPDTSRSAVLGKIHRLGLSGRVTISRTKNSVRIKPKTQAKKPPQNSKSQFPSIRSASLRKLYEEPEPFQPSEELVIPVEQRRTVAMLEEHHCRWPIGDPREKEFHFCGADKVDGLPYCEFHCRKAFQVPHGKKPAGAPTVTASKPVVAEPNVDAGEVELEDVE